MTQKGYDELVAKLQQMESVDRPAASAAIAEARDKGDLSENAEYDAAKEHQGKLETEIAMLKKTIIEAKIIDTTHLDTSTVQILSTVELRNVKNKMTMKYTIVSATEADLKSGKISVETPIAKGLLGKKVGDIAEIRLQLILHEIPVPDESEIRIQEHAHVRCRNLHRAASVGTGLLHHGFHLFPYRSRRDTQLQDSRGRPLLCLPRHQPPAKGTYPCDTQTRSRLHLRPRRR